MTFAACCRGAGAPDRDHRGGPGGPGWGDWVCVLAVNGQRMLVSCGILRVFAGVASSVLMRDESLTAGRFDAVILGLVGADVWRELGTERTKEAACLAAVLSYAMAGVSGRRFRRLGVSSLAAATGQVTVWTSVLLPIVPVIDQSPDPHHAGLGYLRRHGGSRCGFDNRGLPGVFPPAGKRRGDQWDAGHSPDPAERGVDGCFGSGEGVAAEQWIGMALADWVKPRPMTGSGVV